MKCAAGKLLFGVLYAALAPIPAFGAEPAFLEVPLGVPKGNFAAVVLADFDGDRTAEILSGRREGEEGLFLFSLAEPGKPWRRHEITAAGSYGGITLADITGDGLPDLAAVKTDGPTKGLELFRTRRTKEGPRFDALPSPFTAVACDDVTSGDIEGDGDIDLAISTGGKGLLVLINEGRGEKWRHITCETGNYEDTGIAFGDANGDGRLDVVAANHPGKNPRLFLCAGKGPVSYDKGHDEGLVVGPGIGYRMTFADINGDGKQDLAFGSSSGVQLYIGNGCTGPEASWWKPAQLAGGGDSQSIQVSAADIDGDGKIDLAWSSDSGIHVRLNAGGGKFSPRLENGLPAEGSFSGCVPFDWDSDGDFDIVTSSMEGDGLRLYENTSPQAARGKSPRR
ncbi:MAG: FG-GAP repeat domain-containing protein [Verrucomicrobiales bacterium]